MHEEIIKKQIESNIACTDFRQRVLLVHAHNFIMKEIAVILIPKFTTYELWLAKGILVK
jgi:hypothetical protein